MSRSIKNSSITLTQAIWLRQEARVESLLNEGANVDARDQNGNSALHQAVRVDEVGLVRLLLAHGADWTLKNYDSFSPYDIALHLNRAECLEVILKTAEATLCTDEFYRFSGWNQPVRVVELFFEHVDVEMPDQRGYYPLHHAVNSNNLWAVKLLLKRGADIHRRTKSSDGHSPFHLCKSAECAELLLRNGAEVNCRNNYNRSLLDCIVIFNITDIPTHDSESIIELLLDKGADVSMTVRTGQIAFECGEPARKVKKIYRNLLKHMGKLEERSMYRAMPKLRLMESVNVISDFYQSCLDEIEAMKAEKLYSNVTLADFVVERRSVLANYVRNKALVKSFYLKKSQFKESYPIYRSVLLRHFKAAKRFSSLFDSASMGLSIVVRKFNVDDLVVRSILQLLDTDDLSSLTSLYEEYLEDS